MEIQGKIIAILDKVEGQGAKGPWMKQSFILETDGQYPKKVCIDIWNEKVNVATLKIGEPVTVSIEVASREYNGKWFTDVRGWRVSSMANSNDLPDDEKAIDESNNDTSSNDYPWIETDY